MDINTAARATAASLGSDHQDCDSDTDNVEMGANKVRSISICYKNYTYNKTAKFKTDAIVGRSFILFLVTLI